MSQPFDSLIGQHIAGYHITAVLGIGGMAKVYRAEDRELNRDVAIKVLSGPLATDESYLERFRSEARRVAALNHPNIVPIYQFGEDRGTLFIVMPIMAGSLRDRLEREHILPLTQAVQLVTQIAAALQAAHSQGLVHRDVKPENILLNERGVAYLTDFGIAREAKALRQSATKRTLSPSGLPVGTPEYMSPEQLQGGAVDHRADIYALGAVCYELMTGTSPFAAATPYSVAIRALSEAPIPPSQLNSAVPPQLESVVLRALATNPDDRYQDMKSFVDALSAASGISPFLPDSPISPAGVEAAGAWTLANPLVPATYTADGDQFQTSQTAATVPARPRIVRTGIGRSRRLNTYRWIVAAVLLGLLLLTGGGILLSRQGRHSIVPTPPLGNLSTRTISVSTSSNATPTTAKSTATSQASGTPGALTTPTVGLLLTPTPVFALPSPTPTIALPTQTPVTVRSLQLDPADQVPLTKQTQTCTGSQVISNPNAIAVSWQWTGATPNIIGLQYKTSGPAWLPGLPSSAVAANGSTTLSIKLNCSGSQHNSVTMSDNQGHAYSFTLQLT